MSADIAVAVGAAVGAGAVVAVGGTGVAVGSPSPHAMNAAPATTTTAGMRSLASVFSVNVNIALPPWLRVVVRVVLSAGSDACRRVGRRSIVKSALPSVSCVGIVSRFGRV